MAPRAAIRRRLTQGSWASQFERWNLDGIALSSRAMSRPQAEASHPFGEFVFWGRARTSILGLVLGLGLVALWPPLERVIASLLPPSTKLLPTFVAQVDRATSRDTGPLEVHLHAPHVPSFSNRDWGVGPVLQAPRIENHGDEWRATDLLGLSSIEIAVEADPAQAEAELLAWIRSICDTQPRSLYLMWFDEPTHRDRLERELERACPSIAVRPVMFGPTRYCGTSRKRQSSAKDG